MDTRAQVLAKLGVKVGGPLDDTIDLGGITDLVEFATTSPGDDGYFVVNGTAVGTNAAGVATAQATDGTPAVATPMKFTSDTFEDYWRGAAHG